MKTLTLLIATTLCAGMAQAAPLQKCVDDKGRVYYGDAIPAEVLDKCRTSSELSKKGMEKNTTRHLTDEEKQAERQAREDAVAQQKLDDEKAVLQKRRDKALLDTYTDEKEINLSRDRNLQAAQAQIDGSKTRVKAAQERVSNVRKQIADLTKTKKSVPAYMNEELKAAEDELKTSNSIVAKWQQEYEAIRLRFENDKKRFRELKGLSSAAPAAGSAK